MSAAPPVRRRSWRWLAAAAVVATAAAVAWALGSTALLRAALEQAVQASGGRLAFEGASGSLRGTLRVDRLSWSDAGVRVELRGLEASWSPAGLLRRRLELSGLSVLAVEAELTPSGEPASLPASLALPLEIGVREVAVGRLALRAGDVGVDLQRLGLAYAYRDGAHAVEGLRFDSAWGSVSGASARLADAPPYAVSARVSAFGRSVPTALGQDDPRGTLLVGVGVAGTLESLAAEARVRLAGASGSASLLVEPFAPRPLRAAAFAAEGVDLSGFFAGAPSTALAARGRLAGDGDALRLELENARPGPLDRALLPVQRASLGLSRSGDAWALSDARVGLARGGSVEIDGTIAATRTTRIAGIELPEADLRLRASALDLSALRSDLPSTALTGRATLAGGILSLDLVEPAIAGADGPLSLAARLRTEGRTLVADRAELGARDGRLRASGRIALEAPHRFEARGEALRFAPGRWLAAHGLRDARFAATTLLNGEWTASGTLGDPLRLEAALSLRDSRLAREPLSGSIAITLDGERLARAAADLAWGRNRVTAEGALGEPGDRLVFAVDARRLATILPDLGGALRVDGELRGPLRAPVLAATASGSALSWQGRFAAGTLGASLRLPTDGTGPFEAWIEALDLRSGSTTIDRLAIDARGMAEAHEFRVAAAGAAHSLVAAGSGRLEPAAAGERAWEATLREAEVVGPVRARLSGPASLRLGADGVRLAGLALALPEGAVRVGAFEAGGGRFASAGEIAGLPARTAIAVGELFRKPAPQPRGGNGAAGAMPPVAADPAELDALRIDGSWSLAGSSASDLDGDLRLALREVSVPGAPRLGLSGPNRLELAIRAGALDGRLQLELPSLAFSRRYTGADWAADGELKLSARVRGTFDDPAFEGELEGSRLSLLQRSMGWRLEDGSLAARFDGQTLRVDSLRMRSGEGILELRGEARIPARAGTTGPQARFDFDAQRFPVLLGPGQRLVVSGDTEIVADGRSVLWKGSLRADEGLIELRGSGVPEAPGDVVVVDRRRAAPAGAETRSPRAEAAPALRVGADLGIDLGDRIRVTGGGVDAKLAGRLELKGWLPGEPRLTGSVEVREGTYTAYGQQLDIRRGRLRFGGEVDDPALDVVAVRRFLPVEAGVAISGTARAPRVRLISTPDVPDAEKLSWLVLGVGLENAAGSAQALALQQAAAAFLGDDDGTISGGIARALGLDVVAIGPSRGITSSSTFSGRLEGPGVLGAAPTSGSPSAAQQSVVTVGKRLSSRLFVSYEQGLRTVWNLVRIQYDITNRVSLRAQTGTESALDLLYFFWLD